MSAASVAQLKSFLSISLGLATVSLGLSLTGFGAKSFWLIPIAWLLTEIHHWGLWFQFRRTPQPQRWFIHMYFALMVWWVGGAAITFARYAVAASGKTNWTDTAGLVSGIFAVLEAGFLGELWRRTNRLAKEAQGTGEGTTYGLLQP